MFDDFNCKNINMNIKSYEIEYRYHENEVTPSQDF